MLRRIALKSNTLWSLFVLCAIFAVGCGQPDAQKSEDPAAARKKEKKDKVAQRQSTETKRGRTQAELLADLKAKNPGFAGELVMQPAPDGSGLVVGIRDPALKDISPLADLPIANLELVQCPVKDIGPLKGMKLTQLYLEETPVEDLGPLKDMPLMKLYLSNTKVKDLGPLKGSPVQELNLLGTAVTDLSPLAGSQIKMLWLNDCPVSDIGPLKDVPLVSLTLAGTKVADLSPLRGTALQRLHIADTPVTDLSPLEGLQLKRLIFTPARITKGIEIVRAMKTLTELDTQFDDPLKRHTLSPAEFWPLYDAGKFK
jgi:internalin A